MQSKSHPTYRLHLYDDDGFLMAGVKRKKNRTSNYMICLDDEQLSRDSDSFFGKVRSNFVGTEFLMYDDGVNPKKQGNRKGSASLEDIRRELGCVMYQSNLLGTKGPRQMTVVLPSIDPVTEQVLSIVLSIDCSIYLSIVLSIYTSS